MMHGHGKSRLGHSSCEAGEQSGAICCGSWWSEGPRPTGMWTISARAGLVPHKRVKDAGSHTAAYSCRGTQGGNRMRESCMYGSVRGARGNSHPYRAGLPCCDCSQPLLALCVFRCGAKSSDAVGGTADIDRPPAPIAFEAYDPEPTSAAQGFRTQTEPCPHFAWRPFLI